MEKNNNFSILIEKNSLSKITKSSSYQNQKPKITTLIPDSLKSYIQLIEQNNFEKFNFLIKNSEIPKTNLNSLLCFCLQNYSNKKNILEQIKLLINKGADIDTMYRSIYELSNNNSPKVEENYDTTLLMYACLYNDKKLIELFINKNNINSLDKNGKPVRNGRSNRAYDTKDSVLHGKLVGCVMRKFCRNRPVRARNKNNSGVCSKRSKAFKNCRDSRRGNRDRL